MEFVVAMGVHLHLAEQLKNHIGQHRELDPDML